MKYLKLIALTLLMTLPLLAQPNWEGGAESDLDPNTPYPVLQEQTQRMRDELREKSSPPPSSGQQRAPRKAPPSRPGSFFAPEQNAESDTDTRVPQPIWLKQRDLILNELKEKPHDPAITAQIKAKWKNQYKRTYGHMTRGNHAVVPETVPTAAVPTVEGTHMVAGANRYTTEMNLFVDYETEWNWTEAKLQFKNDMGIESGTDNKISLQKAWIGYDFFDNCWGDLDGEIGRKPTSEIFDSRLLFDSTFDGLLVTWRHKWEKTGRFLFHGGPDLVDARTTQFAFIGEFVWEEALATGAYGKLSLSWWRHRGADRHNVYNSPKYRYIIPQLLLGYDIPKEYCGIPIVIYAAGLYNCAAEANVSSNFQRQPFGWYAAIQFGKLKKCGDFFFDVCYQDVGAQTVPDFDNSGIGRGNATSWGDKPVIAAPFDPANYTVPANVLTIPASQVQGNSNYRGIEIRFYYNITDELTFRATADVSRQRNRAIGGTNTYRAGELQLIFGF